MKPTTFFLLLLGFANCTAPTQQASATLDGRTFKIESVTGGKSEGKEMMIFKDGKVENDVCTQWGFGSAPYVFDTASGTFKYTLSSKVEGQMDWEGKLVGNAVSGTMIWVKAGQNDIHYTFQGTDVRGK